MSGIRVDEDGCCVVCGRGVEPCHACANVGEELLRSRLAAAGQRLSSYEGWAKYGMEELPKPLREETDPRLLSFMGYWLKTVHDAAHELTAEAKRLREALKPRRSEEWHEDLGPALWFVLPIHEPPYSGTPLDSDWPYGEDGDGEGAVWPVLQPDETLVWVSLQPITEMVIATFPARSTP